MKKLFITLISAIFMLWWISLAGNYTSEQQDAYNYAYSQKITTASSIENANMNGSLTRIAMAKMISYFAVNVLWLKPDTSKNCTFSDVSSSLDSQYNYGVTQACQLWLMWIWNDWKKSDKFDPYGTVTRGQFATVFSRALSQKNWDTVWEEQPYYKRHLQYLNNKWIIKDVNTPTPGSYEKRWNVMIMMYRYSKNEKVTEKVTENIPSIKDWVQVEYYDNWKVRKVLNYKDGKLNWEYVEYFEDGSVKSEGTYKDWKLEGYAIRYCEKWEESKWYYYRDGKCIRWEWNYESGEYITRWPYKSYYDNWKLRAELNKNKDWELDWDYISYYENGLVEQKWQYKNGKKTWEWIEYFKDGEVKSKWSYKNGELDGYWIRYCERWDNSCAPIDGNFKEWKEIFWAEEYWTFTTYSYWPNKQVQSAAFYDSDWNRNWDYVSFYESGKLKEQWQYKNDKETWKWVEYYENWNIKLKWTYKDWEFDWDYISYYENGRVEEKWQYKDGKETWEWIEYYDNWKIHRTLNYKDGKLNWEYVEYFEDGSVAFKWSYKDEELDGYWTRYRENGHLRMKWQYKNGKETWGWIQYYNSWKIRRTLNYKDGKLNWEYVEYFEDGSVASKWSYKDGELDGY